MLAGCADAVRLKRHNTTAMASKATMFVPLLLPPNNTTLTMAVERRGCCSRAHADSDAPPCRHSARQCSY